MSVNSTRRAILAGAASVPALALSGRLVAAEAAHDPIYAAIEEHRAAFIEDLAAMGDTLSDDKDLATSAESRRVASYQREQTAAIALTDIRPTTIAGVVALLSYVDHFNRRGIKHPTRRLLYSEHLLWPEDLEDDDGRELPFAYWLLENVREALTKIGGQSQMAS